MDEVFKPNILISNFEFWHISINQKPFSQENLLPYLSKRTLFKTNLGLKIEMMELKSCEHKPNFNMIKYALKRPKLVCNLFTTFLRREVIYSFIHFLYQYRIFHSSSVRYNRLKTETINYICLLYYN